MSVVRLNDSQLQVQYNSTEDGLLIKTMQYVEPIKSGAVPNHLLDTKIYSKITRNNFVLARPAVIHFAGFELNCKKSLPLELVNISPDVLRMHIIPPQTRYFSLKYDKKERLVPGLSISCKVEFQADEWRYYYDCIRIHTQGEENIVIPVHAYPVLTLVDFPKEIRFNPIALGDSDIQIIPLECNCPIDFEYNVAILKTNSAFKVEPMSGIVTAHKNEEILVKFTPIDFASAMIRIQITVSEFNSKPLICNVYGKAEPGLLRDQVFYKYNAMEAENVSEDSSDYEQDDAQLLNVDDIRPLERSRRKKEKSQVNMNNIIEKDGLRFGENLNTVHAVNQVLNQEPGKLSMSELKLALSAKARIGTSRQMKEAEFEKLVLDDIEAEKRNKFKWQVHVGQDALKNEERINILNERQDAWNAYKLYRGDPIIENEYNRTRVKCEFSRNTRDSTSIASDNDAKFDVYTNDMWAVRQRSLFKFQQAARKIIIRRRCKVRLKNFVKFVTDWNEGKFTITSDSEKDLRQTIHDQIILTPSRIKSVTFPTYVDPTQKDDLAVDALGSVPVKDTQVLVKRVVPYHKLKVPQQYKLLQYSTYNVHDVGYGYVDRNHNKKFKHGADDEVIVLDKSDVALFTENLRRDEKENDNNKFIEGSVVFKSNLLEAPALLQNRNRKAAAVSGSNSNMKIFNPFPGSNVREMKLEYSEIDEDFHLCPIPAYPVTETNCVHVATRKSFLDHNQVVKNSMVWKKFPSQGLASLSNTPTLTNVWVPRWADTFSDELLPNDRPVFLNGLPDKDIEIVNELQLKKDGDLLMEEIDMNMISEQFAAIEDLPNKKTAVMGTTATPAMTSNVATTGTEEIKPTGVKDKNKEEMFPYGDKMPATNIPISQFGYVQKENREKELDYFLTRKCDQLGNKIQQRIEKWKGNKLTTHD